MKPQQTLFQLTIQNSANDGARQRQFVKAIYLFNNTESDTPLCVPHSKKRQKLLSHRSASPKHQLCKIIPTVCLRHCALHTKFSQNSQAEKGIAFRPGQRTRRNDITHQIIFTAA
jgi:hypothetical protein